MSVLGDEGWGYIDTSGREVIACKYHEVGDFSEGFARVERGNFIDKNGKELLDCSYPYSSDKFSEGLAWIGYLDQKEMAHRSEMNFWLSIEGTEPFYPFDEQIKIFYFIDKTGNKVLGPYEDVQDISDGLAAVIIGGKWGL